MSKSISGEHNWAKLNEVQKAETVRSGSLTLKQLTEGLQDGLKELRSSCREYLAHTDASLEDFSLDTDARNNPLKKLATESKTRS